MHRLLCAAAACAALASGPALADRYALDPVHTRVAFQVSHAGLSNPVGTFSGATGWLEFDEADWRGARLSVRIPLSRLDLGDAKWQAKVLDRTFLDARRFPEARFESRSVTPLDARHARVDGDLTLHGVTQVVTLLVTLNAVKRHPLTLRRTAGFSATAVLSRRAFGIDAWKTLVGDEVRLTIEVEAERDGDAGPAGAPLSPGASEELPATAPPAASP